MKNPWLGRNNLRLGRKNPWLGISVVTTTWLAVMAGCSSGSEPGGDGDGSTSQTSESTTSTEATTTGTTSNPTTTGTTATTTTGIDLTSGTDDTQGDTGDFGDNGGTVPLTAEQIAAIVAGECEGATSEARPVPPVIELVVDVSQSMGTTAPGEPFGGRTRWDLARPALLAALDGLSDDMAVGLQLFPTSDPEDFNGGPGGPFPFPGTGGGPAAGSGGSSGSGGDAGTANDACVSADGRVPIAVLGPAGSPQRQALADAMNDTPLYFGTPTHDAYHNALEEGLKPYDGPGDKFMLLMTDGAPTQLIGCGELGNSQMAVGLEPILAEVTATTATGIRTFVIGSPGSEAGEAGDMRSFLSEMAQVGGTGPMGCAVDGPAYCHFDMTAAPNFSEALSKGLADIAEQVVSTCTFAKPTGEGVNLDDTSVVIQSANGGVLVLHDGEGDCTEGWVWNAKEEIELCPQTCATLEGDPSARVSVSFGCEDVLR